MLEAQSRSSDLRSPGKDPALSVLDLEEGYVGTTARNRSCVVLRTAEAVVIRTCKQLLNAYYALSIGIPFFKHTNKSMKPSKSSISITIGEIGCEATT
jgi:hypothetical protein